MANMMKNMKLFRDLRMKDSKVAREKEANS